MSTLSVVCIGTNGNLYGNSIPVEEIDADLIKRLNASIDHCTDPSWPRILIKSDGPVQVTSLSNLCLP